MNPPTPKPPYSNHVPIRRDDAGNPFIQDLNGNWVPHLGHFSQSYGATPSQTFPNNIAVATADIPHDNMRDGPNSPMSHAFPPATPRPNPTASTSQLAIDPALLPLPDDDDNDLSDGPTIAKARGYAPVEKVAGSRQKSKGKQRAMPADDGRHVKGKTSSRKRKHDSDDSEGEENAKRGRPRGAGNYSVDDISALLDKVEAELPLGQRGWQAIHKGYTRWARTNGRPERTIKSIETKFKQLVKTTKPTGNAYCPPDVKRAHYIDGLISERACTRDLADSDFDGAAKDNSSSSDDEVEVLENPKKALSKTADVEKAKPVDPEKAVRSAVVRRPDPTLQRRPRNNGMELISKLTDAFDPSAQQARDAERANRSLQNAQFLSLSQQLRDATATIESLRNQNSTLQLRIHETDRARDRAELKLEMLEMTTHHPPPFRRSRARRSASTKRDIQRVNGKVRCEEKFPEGGSHTYWVTDPSSSDEKENVAPDGFMDYDSPPRHMHIPGRHYRPSYPRRRHQSPLSALSSYKSRGTVDSLSISLPAPEVSSAEPSSSLAYFTASAATGSQDVGASAMADDNDANVVDVV